jgi:phosphoglycolate phosphatase-like HAD superfamily hydrolase
MPPRPTLVWLFDIDGTLLLTGGAGRDSMALALRDHFGIEDDLSGIAFAGRTDVLIAGDIAARHGLAFENGAWEAYWERVYAHMRALMTPPRGALLPGVRTMLDVVAAEPAWVSGLLTGNMPEMARIKLGAFGIAHHFAFGAYGDDGPDRNAVARVAVERALRHAGLPASRCVVVGDTEHDVACARAAGAHVVAVATGGRPRDALAAEGPDLLLDDLRDPAPLLEWAWALAAR